MHPELKKYFRNTNFEIYGLATVLLQIVDSTTVVPDVRPEKYAGLLENERRFFYSSIIRWTLPLPKSLIDKIEAQYSDRSYLETIGARLGQVPRSSINACSVFYR